MEKKKLSATQKEKIIVKCSVIKLVFLRTNTGNDTNLSVSHYQIKIILGSCSFMANASLNT